MLGAKQNKKHGIFQITKEKNLLMVNTKTSGRQKEEGKNMRSFLKSFGTSKLWAFFVPSSLLFPGCRAKRILETNFLPCQEAADQNFSCMFFFFFINGAEGEENSARLFRRKNLERKGGHLEAATKESKKISELKSEAI